MTCKNGHFTFFLKVDLNIKNIEPMHIKKGRFWYKEDTTQDNLFPLSNFPTMNCNSSLVSFFKNSSKENLTAQSALLKKV